MVWRDGVWRTLVWRYDVWRGMSAPTVDPPSIFPAFWRAKGRVITIWVPK